MASTITVKDVKLRLVSAAVDHLLKWCSDTYLRLRTQSSSLLFVVATCDKRGLNRKPFKFPQRAGTMIQYASRWKQLLIYAIRTSSIDEAQREKLYGIQFTDDQLSIIQELNPLAEGLALDDVPINPIFQSCNPSHQGHAAPAENPFEVMEEIDNDIMSDDSDEEEEEENEEDDNSKDHMRIDKPAATVMTESPDVDCIMVLSSAVDVNHDHR